MQIWVDADACPKAIKEILFRAADRTKTNLILVANQDINIPLSPFISKVRVSSGFDEADAKIIAATKVGDLVITADIPLASAVIKKGGAALNPRGKMYLQDNISEYLVMRNFAEDLRSSGVITGGPAKLSQKEIQLFSNELDRFLIHC